LRGLAGETVDRVAFPGALLVRVSLADTLKHVDLDALFARPARKPRTVWEAQPILSAISGPLAPSRRRSMARTCACFVSFRGREASAEGISEALLPGPRGERRPTVQRVFAVVAIVSASVPSIEECQRGLAEVAVSGRQYRHCGRRRDGCRRLDGGRRGVPVS
jgi:hypothetical protein